MEVVMGGRWKWIWVEVKLKREQLVGYGHATPWRIWLTRTDTARELHRVLLRRFPNQRMRMRMPKPTSPHR